MDFKSIIDMSNDTEILPRLPETYNHSKSLKFIRNTQDIFESENRLQIKNWIDKISKQSELIVPNKFLIRQNAGPGPDQNDYYDELFMINKNLKNIAKTKSDYIDLLIRLEQYTASYLINKNLYLGRAWYLSQQIKSRISKL